VSGPFQFRINDYPIELLDSSGRAVSGMGLSLLACWCGSNPAGGIDVCLFRVLCIVRQMSVGRADHMFRVWRV